MKLLSQHQVSYIIIILYVVVSYEDLKLHNTDHRYAILSSSLVLSILASTLKELVLPILIFAYLHKLYGQAPHLLLVTPYLGQHR